MSYYYNTAPVHLLAMDKKEKVLCGRRSNGAITCMLDRISCEMCRRIAQKNGVGV